MLDYVNTIHTHNPYDNLCTECFIFQNHSPSRDAVDAFMIVYSVTDMDSWEAVVDILQSITQRETIRPATILVANKMDLVRGRVVSTNGKLMYLVI